MLWCAAPMPGDSQRIGPVSVVPAAWPIACVHGVFPSSLLRLPSSSSLAPVSFYNCPNFRPGKPGNVHSFDSRLSFSVCMDHLGTDSAVQI